MARRPHIFMSDNVRRSGSDFSPSHVPESIDSMSRIDTDKKDRKQKQSSPQHTTRREKDDKLLKTKPTGIHHTVKRFGINERDSKHIKLGRKSLRTPKLTGRRKEFSQKARKIKLRNRKLRDRYHQSAKDKNTQDSDRPLRVMSHLQSKYQQTAVVHRNLSVRSVLTSQPLQNHWKNKVHTQKYKSAATNIITSLDKECSFNKSFQNMAESQVANAQKRPAHSNDSHGNNHNALTTFPMEAEEGGQEDPVCDEPLHQSFPSSTAGVNNLWSKTDVPEELIGFGPGSRGLHYRTEAWSFISKREIVQLPDNSRYVKRFAAEGGRCRDYGAFTSRASAETSGDGAWGIWRKDVHVAETVVTVIVKDINDNAPVFPNTTIYGEVQENGPIGEYPIFRGTL